MSQCFSFEVETDIDMKTLGLSGCTAGTEDLEFLGLETLELNASSSVWTTGGKWRHFYFCLLSLSSNQIKIISLLYLEKRLSLEACCVALAPYKFLSTTEIQKLFIESLLGTRQRPAFMNRQWARTQQQLQRDAVKKINPSERMWRGGRQVKPLWEEYIWVHPQRWEEWAGESMFQPSNGPQGQRPQGQDKLGRVDDQRPEWLQHRGQSQMG